MTATTGYQWTRRVGVTPSIETRAKLSAAMVGNKHGTGNFQKIKTPEARARCSAAVLLSWRKRRASEEIPERWQKIAFLRDLNLTQRAIGWIVGISQQRVTQILKKIERRGEGA